MNIKNRLPGKKLNSYNNDYKEELLVTRCQCLENMTSTIKNLTDYHWLTTDFARNFEHYMYGAPREDE